MDHGLTDAVAIVTGAAREDGIGFAAVRSLLERGAAGVIMTDLDTEQGQESAAKLEADFPGRTVFRRHDVTALDDWADVTQQALERFGRLDILFNNAGIPLVGTIEQTDIETLRRGMAVNFDSQYLAVRHCAPILARFAERRRGGASIINNSSMAAYLVDPGNVAYHISKAAGRMLTMCAAREFGPRRIRVNSVHYGPILTSPMKEALGRYADQGQFADAEAARAGIASLSPLGVIGTPEEAGALVAYLASDEARFVTGAAYRLDGGCFMQY